MIVEISARLARNSGTSYITCDWQVREYGQAWRKACGGIVWSDFGRCSEVECVRDPGHDGVHRNGRGTSWTPITEEEFEELQMLGFDERV